MRRESTTAVLATLFLAASASAGVIIVDSNGSGQFTNLQAAVNAAQDGDTLLVKPGAYSSFTISDKALVVVADTGGAVTISGSVAVQNLASQRTVVLAGLTVTGINTSGIGITPGAGLYVHGNLGQVRAQHCTFRGAAGLDSVPVSACVFNGHFRGWEGAYVADNAIGVAFEDCSCEGGPGWSTTACDLSDMPAPDGGDGLHVENTLVALYDSQATGGRGGDTGIGGWGGAGCRLIYVSALTGVIASGSSLRGGDGGNSSDGTAPAPGPGGIGLVAGAGSLSWRIDDTFQGGQGGTASFGGAGPAGQPLSGSGQVYDYAPPRLRMVAPTVMRELTNLPITFDGPPGADVFLVTSLGTAFQPIPSWKGVVLTESVNRARTLWIGTIPPSGSLAISIPIPDLGPGVFAQTRYLQACLVDVSSGFKLGSFAALTILDSAF